MMTAEHLKNSILQLAMEGKLVEQRLEEGTGEEFYQNIQTERGRLIKKGRIKKDKKFSDLITIEYPFDIPETWKWVKFGSVMNVVSARRVHQADWKSRGIPFYRAREIAKLAEAGYVENELFISEELYKEFKKSGAPEPGDLMVTGVGTLGKTYVVKEGDQFYYKDASVLCFENYARLNPYFIKRMMESPLMKGQIKSNSSGTTVATLTMVRMMEYLIPLPPLAEQTRIVAKIEELMPFVEQYATASTKLNTLNANFPDQMKKSILQEAVQGKLVPQNPNDESANVLLKKIAEEKRRLIKEGKIKKQKPLPAITGDEIPFDIPESWEWCHVGDLFDHNTGKAMNSSAKKVNKKGSVRRFITTSNLYWNSFNLSNVKEMFFSDDELARCTATKKDILMCEGGAYFGRTAIWNFDYDICFQNHIHRLRPYVKIKEEFFYYLFYFYRNTGLMKSKGTAMPGLSSVALHELVVPLPPLAEQERIVAKLEKILPLCEGLK